MRSWRNGRRRRLDSICKFYQSFPVFRVTMDMEKELICKNCGGKRTKGRKLCNPCNSLRTKQYYSKEKRTENRKKICPACLLEKTFWKDKAEVCGDCYRESLNTGFAPNNYKMRKRTTSPEHRVLATEILGRNLSFNEVVHHVDENIHNNCLTNLWVMSRKDHGQLHKYLRIQRVIWEKSQSENSVNCWNSLRALQTTAWLEMTSAKVIKLQGLANQQPSS